MAVVTLNQLVFEQAVAEVLDRVAVATHEFESAAEKVQARAGGMLAQEVRECVATLRQELLADAEGTPRPQKSNAGAPTGAAEIVYARSWIAGSILFAGVSFAAGVWLSPWLR